MASYTLEYVYDLDDFLTSGDNITPPNEQSARAAGDPPFTITLDASATSQEIAVDDSDNGVFNEIAAEGQTLEEPGHLKWRHLPYRQQHFDQLHVDHG